MKSRSLVIFALILSLIIVPSMQLALAASTSSTSSTTSSTTTTTTAVSGTPFSERVDIYLAGSNDFWLVKLNPVNETKPGVTAAESIAGVSAYEMTAVKTSAASPSSQLFWGDGYRILKVPFMPDSGVFLNVTATSQGAAAKAAADLGPFVGTNFEQISSSGQNYTFFSPGDFTLAGEIMYTSTVVATNGGLADISSAFSLAADPTPTAILTGIRTGTSFTHTFAFGSTETGAVATNDSLLLTKALSIANDSFLAAPSATSTQVVVHALDGLISTSDAATVSNHQSNFSSSYSFNVPANTRFRPNVTLLQSPPVLTATREVDTGSVVNGGLISVTVLLRNTGNTGTIDNISLNDTWWSAYPTLLSLSAGTSSISVPTLGEGQNASEVYVLKVASSASQDIIVPAAAVSYSYGIGSVTVKASTQTNQVEVRTNDAGPAMMITARSNIPSGSPLGTVGRFVVTVTNTGNSPALNLKVANYTDETLVQGGATWTFNMSIPLTSLVILNLTRTFTLSWEAPNGVASTIYSNPDTVVLSHAGVLLPLMHWNVASTLSPAVLTLGQSNATYTLTNSGNAAASSVSVEQTFASGLVCHKVMNGTATCTPSTISFNTTSVAVGGSLTGFMDMTFGTDNYISEPGLVVTNDSGLTLHTAGTGYVIPAGLLVTRVDNPNPVFQGQNDTVTINVANKGTLPVYNVSVQTTPDIFDHAVTGNFQAIYPIVNASSTDTFNYTVGIAEPGNHTTAAIALSFAFGGFSASYNVFPNTVLIYKDVVASTFTRPSTPTEGSDFSIALSLQNPSKANVTNVIFSLPVPEGLTIVNSSSGVVLHGRTLVMTLSSLAAGATSTRYIGLRSGADGSFALGTGTLTFDYLGATVSGVVSTPAVVVGVDLLLRYEIPIAAAVVLTVLVVYYMHRKLAIPQAK